MLTWLLCITGTADGDIVFSEKLLQPCLKQYPKVSNFAARCQHCTGAFIPPPCTLQFVSGSIWSSLCVKPYFDWNTSSPPPPKTVLNGYSLWIRRRQITSRKCIVINKWVRQLSTCGAGNTDHSMCGDAWKNIDTYWGFSYNSLICWRLLLLLLLA